jgi:hypothetical protein
MAAANTSSCVSTSVYDSWVCIPRRSATRLVTTGGAAAGGQVPGAPEAWKCPAAAAAAQAAVSSNRPVAMKSSVTPPMPARGPCGPSEGGSSSSWPGALNPPSEAGTQAWALRDRRREEGKFAWLREACCLRSTLLSTPTPPLLSPCPRALPCLPCLFCWVT